MLSFKEDSLIIQVIILKINGYIKDIEKLKTVFLITNIWLFLNTAQKEDR